MIIRQISVFLENKPGRLTAAVDVLAKNGIDISALTLADTAEYGVLRMIVDQPDRAKEVLNEAGIVAHISHVVGIAMDDVPGGAVTILHTLSDNGLSIEYTYACVGRISGKALMVVRTDDRRKAEEILEKSGHGQLSPADVYRI